MNIKIHTKKLLYILILNSASFFGTVLGMKELTIITQPENAALNALRQKIYRQAPKSLPIDGVYKTTRISLGIRYGNCHNYAFSKIMGKEGKIHEELPIEGLTDWYTDYNILEHFNPVSTPQKGDIITYATFHINSPLLSRDIYHTGIVYDPNKQLIESRWGARLAIDIHKIFHVPSCYGNTIAYFRPIIQGDELFKAIKKKVEIDKEELRDIRDHYESEFLSIAANSTNSIIFSDRIGPITSIINFLESIICVRVDALNEQNQTPLMLASQAGNLKLIKILIDYGANIDAQDNDGNTPLLHATKSNHPDIAKYLTLLLQKRSIS